MISDTVKTFKHGVKLYFGCGKNRNTMMLKLRDGNVEDWTEYDLNRLTLKTDLITAIEVGPETVLEVFSDPYIYSLKEKMINKHTDKIQRYELGCKVDHGLWAGIMRSFRIWNYAYYRSRFGTRYCNEDSECNDYEYCLCRGGQRKKEWCPKSKKRCVHKSTFLHNKNRQVHLDDFVDLDCLKGKIDDYKKKWTPHSNANSNTNDMAPFRNVKYLIEECSGSDVINPIPQDLSLRYYTKETTTPGLRHEYSLLDLVEGYGPKNNNSLILTLIPVFILAIGLIFVGICDHKLRKK
jgi:hypothetical protein